jgi:hypothetical protein
MLWRHCCLRLYSSISKILQNIPTLLKQLYLNSNTESACLQVPIHCTASRRIKLQHPWLLAASTYHRSLEFLLRSLSWTTWKQGKQDSNQNRTPPTVFASTDIIFMAWTSLKYTFTTSVTEEFRISMRLRLQHWVYHLAARSLSFRSFSMYAPVTTMRSTMSFPAVNISSEAGRASPMIPS